MIGLALLVFLSVTAVFVTAFLLVTTRREAKVEIARRISLLQVHRLKADELPEELRRELLGQVSFADRVLQHFDVARRIDRKLRQADMELKVGSFLGLSALLAAAGTVLGLLLRWHVALALAVGLACGFAPNLYVEFRKRRRVKRFLSLFPDALAMFARSLRAGHSFPGAIQLVGQEMPPPIGPEFQKVFDEQNLGVPMKQALTGLTDRIDCLDAKFFVTAVLIQRETGGNLAEIVDKIANVIRERFRIQGQLKVFTAQARFTGYTLAALPLAMAFLINLLNPDYLKPLFVDPMGKALVTAAVVLQVVGFFVIRKIIRIKI
jgi:tight adherence protein B